MPRKLLKKYLPSPSSFNTKRFGWLGKYMADANLWHLNRHSVARGFAVGLFCAFIPLPTQMIIAAGAAILVRANVPISVGLIWITNPLTIPPIFYCTYQVGVFLLGGSANEVAFEFSIEWISSNFSLLFWPLILGSFVTGIFFSATSYMIIQLLWVSQVNQRWKARKAALRKKGK